MGNKFMILCSKYPYEGCWEYDYSTDSAIKFIYNLIKCYAKYEIIDVQIRNIRRRLSGEHREVRKEHKQ